MVDLDLRTEVINMGYCKKIQMDCMYTDRDNNDNCSLNTCKYMQEIKYNIDGTFTTKPLKIKTTKSTKKVDNDNE